MRATMETTALTAIIAAGADPYERAASAQFRAVATPDELLAERERQWVNAVANGDHLAFARLLDTRGISRAQFRAMLTDVEVVDPADLPEWAQALVAVMDAAAVSERRVQPITVGELIAADGPASVDQDRPWALFAAHEPLLLGAVGHLTSLQATTDVKIAPAAAHDLLVTFARRLFQVTFPTLASEVPPEAFAALGGTSLDLTVVEAYLDGTDVDARSWLQVFELFPVLARLVGIVFAQWRGHTLELITRLDADQAELSEHLGGGSLERLEAVRGDMGDAHRKGRTVTILTFAGDRRVVYKPKNLEVGSAVIALIAQLNELDLPCELGTRWLLTRPDHTWEEFVPTGDCEDEDGPARFYVRMGMLARVLQMLGGHDFTCDNILASGDQPVIVDLESVFRPHSQFSDKTTALRHDLLRAINLSVAPTGMFTCNLSADPGRRALSVSPLDRGEVTMAPWRQPTLARDDVGRLSVVWTYADVPHSNAVATLAGREVDPHDYFDEVLEGYIAMDRCLRQNAEWLASPDGPVAAMALSPVRFLNRNTHIYARLIQQSLKPDRLRDGVTREIEIDRLWKALRVDPHGVVFIHDEVAAVRDLDVPLMQSVPATTEVVLNDETVVANVFAEPALDAVLASIEALPQTDPAAQAAITATLLHCLDPHPTKPPPPRTAIEEQGPTAWTEAASEIAGFVAAQATRCADGDLGFLGAAYRPEDDSWNLAILPPDLLNGLGGLSVVAAEISTVVDDARVASLADELLAAVRRLAPSTMEEFETNRVRAAAPNPSLFHVGGLVGPGAVLHAMARAASALGSIAATQTVVSLISDVDLLPVETLTRDDLVTGRAGLIMNLLAVARYCPDVAEKARELATRVGGGIDPANLRPAAVPDAAEVREELAIDDCGIAMALAALEDATATAPTAAASPTCVPDGGAGSLPAVLELVRRGRGTRAGVQARLDCLVEADIDRLATPDVLNRLEIAVTASEVLEDERQLEHGRHLADELVRRHRVSGSWFPDLRLDDRHNLSAVFGLSGIAHALARIAHPGRFGSIRLLS